MTAVSSLLAEVADKEFTVSTLWIVALTLSAVGFLLAQWRRWTAIVAAMVASVWAFLIVSELRDRFVGPFLVRPPFVFASSRNLTRALWSRCEHLVGDAFVPAEMNGHG